MFVFKYLLILFPLNPVVRVMEGVPVSLLSSDPEVMEIEPPEIYNRDSYYIIFLYCYHTDSL